MAKRYNSRVRVNGKQVRRSHVVWNDTHPDDLIMPGEVIHHKDGNKKNDNPENLAKMKDRKHRQLEADNRLKQWAEKNPQKAREWSQKGVRKMLEVLRSDPAKYERWQEHRRNATIKANRARAGIKHSEEHKQRISIALKEAWRKKKGGGANGRE